MDARLSEWVGTGSVSGRGSHLRVRNFPAKPISQFRCLFEGWLSAGLGAQWPVVQLRAARPCEVVTRRSVNRHQWRKAEGSMARCKRVKRAVHEGHLVIVHIYISVVSRQKGSRIWKKVFRELNERRGSGFDPGSPDSGLAALVKGAVAPCRPSARLAGRWEAMGCLVS